LGLQKDKLSNALAKMLIWLIENEYYNVENTTKED